MTQPRDARKRWDTDDRYGGVADASAFAASIEELASLARRPRWVAEDPGVHLVPHLRDATQSGQSGLRILQVSVSQDGVLTVAFEHPPGASRRDIRRQAWGVLGAIAETMASVRERRADGQVVFDVVTGEPDSATAFASHGHTIRLIVQPPVTEPRSEVIPALS
jgi:hypothetical protein